VGCKNDIASPDPLLPLPGRLGGCSVGLPNSGSPPNGPFKYAVEAPPKIGAALTMNGESYNEGQQLNPMLRCLRSFSGNLGHVFRLMR
jgi:hypothetical protein